MSDKIIPPSGSIAEHFRASLSQVLQKHGISETLPQQTALNQPEELVQVEYFEDGSARLEPTWFKQYKRKAAKKAEHSTLVCRIATRMAESQGRLK